MHSTFGAAWRQAGIATALSGHAKEANQPLGPLALRADPTYFISFSLAHTLGPLLAGPLEPLERATLANRGPPFWLDFRIAENGGSTSLYSLQITFSIPGPGPSVAVVPLSFPILA